MKEEKWKTLIRQKLQDYEETPPPELWNDLMKALPQPEQQRPATVHTRRRWLYGIETALGAAAALDGTVLGVPLPYHGSAPCFAYGC